MDLQAKIDAIEVHRTMVDQYMESIKRRKSLGCAENMEDLAKRMIGDINDTIFISMAESEIRKIQSQPIKKDVAK